MELRMYLRERRTADQLSQQDVAQRLGWSRDKVSNRENGRGRIQAGELALFAAVIPSFSLTKANALLEESAQRRLEQVAQGAGSSAA